VANTSPPRHLDDNQHKGETMAQRVTFGLNYDFRNPEPWQVPWPERYAAILDQIAWVDQELAFDNVNLSEHHFYEDGYLPACMVVCAAIAAKTSRVGIGTNLVQMPLHHPVRLAEEALVNDVLSNGRFRLGVGAGYYWQEFQALGSVLKQRPSRMAEGFEILRLAFAGRPFSYHGKRFEIPEILVTPTPIRPGGPEIWAGAFVPDAIDRLARYADGFLAFGDGTIGEYLAACERHGRPPEQRQVNRTYWAIIDEDPERAFAAAGPHFVRLYNDYIKRDAYPDLEVFEDPQIALRLGLQNGHLIMGDADTAIAQINQDIALGTRDITFHSYMPGEDVDEVSRRLQYMSDHVIPHAAHVDNPGQRLTPTERPWVR
jgi:alkanesulfonate monooxygenase SsuD/methylene tetrahydromethanopterin reductase-like flavin-dependent oxidoreductase (luciferase family)